MSLNRFRPSSIVHLGHKKMKLKNGKAKYVDTGNTFTLCD